MNNLFFYDSTFDMHLETLILGVVNQGNFEQTDNPQIVMSQVFPKGEDDQIRKTRSKYEGGAVRKEIKCDPQRQKSNWTEALVLVQDLDSKQDSVFLRQTP